MRIGVVGINHKLADLKLRETLAKGCQHHFGGAKCSHPNHSFLLLSTCNRTEIYFSSSDLAAAHCTILQLLNEFVAEEFDQKLYSYFSQDCFTHLIGVTAGLDSAILGETEIQGQVKAAYAKAQKAGTLPHELHYLFQKSLKISKSLRLRLPNERGLPTLEDALYNTGKSFFSDIDNCSVLFVGASAINLKILNYFRYKKMEGLTLCNRTDSKSRAIADKQQVDILPWSHLRHWQDYDWIIFGTKAPDPLIGKSAPPSARKLIIDLSVPRNVDPGLAHHPNVTLWNIDQINNALSHRQKQQKELLSLAAQEAGFHANKHLALFKRKTTEQPHFLTA